MSRLFYSLLSSLVVLPAALVKASPLPVDVEAKAEMVKRWNDTYVGSVSQCPALTPRSAPPTSVHDLYVILYSGRPGTALTIFSEQAARRFFVYTCVGRFYYCWCIQPRSSDQPIPLFERVARSVLCSRNGRRGSHYSQCKHLCSKS
jgi:hypothetical protein